jgi:hypothetical protein
MVDMSVDDNYEGEPGRGHRLQERMERQRKEIWAEHGPCPWCGHPEGDVEPYRYSDLIPLASVPDSVVLTCWDCGTMFLVDMPEDFE